MAELNVQPKSKNPWWIWLIVAIILLGIIFFFTGGNNENSDTVPPNTESDTTGVTGMGTTDFNWSNIAATDCLFVNEEIVRNTGQFPAMG